MWMVCVVWRLIHNSTTLYLAGLVIIVSESLYWVVSKAKEKFKILTTNLILTSTSLWLWKVRVNVRFFFSYKCQSQS